MIAFEVYRNGVKLCTAGAEDLAVLTATLCAGGRIGKNAVAPREGVSSPEIHGSVGGLTGRLDPDQDAHLRWVFLEDIQVGDQIEIRVIETDHADPPEEITPANRRL